MAATYRRELWIAKDDGKVYKIARVPRDIPGQEAPAFVLGETQPVYFSESTLTDAGPFAPPNATIGDVGIAGIKPGVSRSNYSGSINWNTPQNLKDMNFTGAAAASMRAITGTDHVISNVFLKGLDTNTTNPSTGGIIDCRASSCARLRFEHITIRPTYPNDRWDGIYGHDFTAYRCLIERTVDGIAALNPYSPNLNVNVEGSWIGNLAWYDDDRGAHTNGTHNDCIQHHTGLYLNFIGNTLWGYKWNALNPNNDSGGTTPLAYGSSNTSNRWPQVGQGIIDQTEAYYHNGNAVYDKLWIYGCDQGIKPGSKCGVSGHSHRYASNQTVTNILFMNDDQRDYGGSLRWYNIRTDTAATFNNTSGWSSSGATDTPTAWNIRYGNSSSADRKLNVDPSRRGQLIKVRADAV